MKARTLQEILKEVEVGEEVQVEHAPINSTVFCKGEKYLVQLDVFGENHITTKEGFVARSSVSLFSRVKKTLSEKVEEVKESAYKEALKVYFTEDYNALKIMQKLMQNNPEMFLEFHNQVQAESNKAQDFHSPLTTSRNKHETLKDVEKELVTFLLEGHLTTARKVEAIKYARDTISGFGLRDAKIYVENLMSIHNIPLVK